MPSVLHPKALALRTIGLAQRLGHGLRRRGWGSSYLGRMGIDALLWPADAVTARRGYYRAFGSMPRLLRPRTFNEKLQHSKLFRRKPLHTVLADKIAVRSYVSERVGAEVLTKLYWTGTDLQSVSPVKLPPKFVLKANHACGTNLIVHDRDAFDWEQARELTRLWLGLDYSICGAEWQYRWIEPRLLIEELLSDADGAIPSDYKFFCLNGRVECVQIDIDRYARHMRAFVDRSFEPLDIRLVYPRHEGTLERPSSFAAMLEIAEALSKGQPFARVDLYDIGRPVFGEITLHPGSGTQPFDPATYDQVLGSRIRF
jgi:hypothetical protein